MGCKADALHASEFYDILSTCALCQNLRTCPCVVMGLRCSKIAVPSLIPYFGLSHFLLCPYTEGVVNRLHPWQVVKAQSTWIDFTAHFPNNAVHRSISLKHLSCVLVCRSKMSKVCGCSDIRLIMLMWLYCLPGVSFEFCICSVHVYISVIVNDKQFV